MNDKLILDNYLMVIKSTVEVYVHGTLESSNKKVKDLLKDCLNETLTHQEKTYNEMTKRDFYTVSNVKSSEICKTLEKLKNSQN